MKKDTILDVLKSHKHLLKDRYGVTKIGLFGSVARGEDTSASDIDLLVKFAKRKSLLDIVKLERELSAGLGKKVDLLTEAAISPYMRDRILSELKVIYGN